MGRLRKITVGLLGGSLLLGVYFVSGQEVRPPWPPRPVKPPELTRPDTKPAITGEVIVITPPESPVPAPRLPGVPGVPGVLPGVPLPPPVMEGKYLPDLKPDIQQTQFVTKKEIAPAPLPAREITFPPTPRTSAPEMPPAPALPSSPALPPAPATIEAPALPKTPTPVSAPLIDPVPAVPTGTDAKKGDPAAAPAAPLPAPQPPVPLPPGPAPRVTTPPPAAIVPWSPKDTPPAKKEVSTSPPAPQLPQPVMPIETTPVPLVDTPKSTPVVDTEPPPSAPSVPAKTTVAPRDPEGVSRFVVSPRKSVPAPVVPAPSPEVSPAPAMAAPEPPVVPAIRRFQPVKVWKAPPAIPAVLSGTPAALSPTMSAPVRNAPADTRASAATPQLTVEKRGPYFGKVGQPLQYQILLRNVGTVPATQVRVEDEIPGTNVRHCNPPATHTAADRIVWVVPFLRGGEDKTFLLELAPLRPGDLVSTTSVHVYTTTSFRTRQDGESEKESIVPVPTSPSTPATESTVSGPSLFPSPPSTPSSSLPTTPATTLPTAPATLPAPRVSPLHVEVKSPASATIGQKVIFEVIVSNRGAAPLTGLMLYGKLPAGLLHPEGDHIGADLPDLAPGETKAFKMPMTATLAGRLTVEIRVSSGKDLEVLSQPQIVIAAPGLSIQQSAAPRWILGRENELKIIVTNQESTPLRQVEVRDTLPEGVEFVAASDRGFYQANTRTVAWMLNGLLPGQTQTLSLKVQPRAPGQVPHEVIARAENLPESKSTALYQVEAFSSLAIQLMDRDDPVEVGKANVYSVRITNQGASFASNVQVQVTLSEGLEADGFAQAATAYRVQGKQVFFAPIAKLAPGATASFHLGVRARDAGEQRVRVQVVSDQNRTPTTREERTICYREKD